MRAVIQRLVQLVVVLLLVTLFTARLLDLVPGDVTNSLAPVSTPAQRQELRHELKLDRPFFTRYADWVNGVAHGDLGCYYGTSGYTSASTCPDKVADRVKDALPTSLTLMFYAQVMAFSSRSRSAWPPRTRQARCSTRASTRSRSGSSRYRTSCWGSCSRTTWASS